MTTTPDAAVRPRSTSTGTIRMRYDLIEKLAVITWAKGHANNADGIDEVLRPDIDRLFGELAPALQKRAFDRIAKLDALPRPAPQPPA